MKLSELRPCDSCGGKLTGEDGRQIQFYILKFSPVILNHRAMNEVMGMHQFFQGKSFVLAELMAPEAAEAAVIVGDQKDLGGTWDELLVCFDCAMGIKPFDLLATVEKRTREIENLKRAKEESDAKEEG